jgi:hypothetical protein
MLRRHEPNNSAITLRSMKPTIHRFRVSKPSANPTTTSPDLGSPRNIGISYPRSYSPIGLQACDRCKRLKKRCSRKLPECDLCEVAGQKCTLIQQAAMCSNSQQLHARIDWLTRYIDENMPNLEPGPTNSTPKSAVELSETLSPETGLTSENLGHVEAAVGDSICQGTPFVTFARAYFRHVHRAYPFLDKSEVLHGASQLSSLDFWRHDPKSMVRRFDADWNVTDYSTRN